MGSVYDSAVHRTEKRRLTPIILSQGAMCTELVCVEASRLIPAGTPSNQWHLAHDRRVHRGVHRCTTACYLGPAHPRCNTREGGQEKHRKANTRRRWAI